MRTLLVGDLIFSQPQLMTPTTPIQMLYKYDSLTTSILAFKAKEHQTHEDVTALTQKWGSESETQTHIC